jgi:HK97 family phage major capsid protein
MHVSIEIHSERDTTMSMTHDEKLSRSQEIAGKMKGIADKLSEARKAGKGWEPGQEAEFKGLSDEYDKLASEINDERSHNKVFDRINQIEEDQKRSLRHGKAKPGLDDNLPGEQRTYGDAGYTRDGAQQYAQREMLKRTAFRGWMIADFAPHLVTSEMRDAANAVGMNINQHQMQVRSSDDADFARLQSDFRSTHPSKVSRLNEERALSKVSTPGSELVPQSWVAQVELAMLTYGPLLSYVTSLTTNTGEVLNYPTGDDTANEGGVVSEGTDNNAAAQPDPTMATIAVGAFEYVSKFIKVPFTLQRDSIVNIDLLVATLVGERMGRIFTNHGTVGTGTNQMQGIRTGSATGVTAASATAISGDDIINLAYSVDAAYRANGIYMANDSIIAAVRRLKDTTGQYLWQSMLREGTPDTLNGRPIIPNSYMASTMVSTNISMLFGDFSKYLFRRVSAGTLYRLQERFAESLMTGYLFHQSADGRLLRANATTLNPVKRLTH